MSHTACPRAADWPALVAHRFARRGEEPAGFRESLAHLEDCPDCRRAALAADPTLVFQRLAGERSRPTATGPARLDEREHERAEAESVRRAVAAMRTASRLAGGTAPRPARAAAWKRWSAAAVLALAALSTGSGPGLRELAAPPMPAAPISPAAPAADFPLLGSVEAAGLRLPVLDELNLPDARVYLMDSPDMSMVWIVDEGLD